MFNSLYETYTRHTPTVTTDAYGQDIPTYIKGNDVEMFISTLTHNENIQNDMRIKNCTHIGLTFDNSLAPKDIIDEKYEVTFINIAKRENIVYLEEKENAGTYN